jgi:hypothetical protein
MPRGYKKCEMQTGTEVDKEVWTVNLTVNFFHQVLYELTCPDYLGVHHFTWAYGNDIVMLSRHGRNKYVDGIILVIILLFSCTRQPSQPSLGVLLILLLLPSPLQIPGDYDCL